jgi:hypothetical protein
VATVSILTPLLDPGPGSIRGFLTDWHHRPRPEYGLRSEEIGRTVPVPLRDFYELAGRWPNVVVQNSLAAPDELEHVDGLLVFYVENQGVYAWATEREGADPPVWGTWDLSSPEWLPEEEPLSRFLLQVVVFEATFGGPEGASAAWLSPEAQEELVSRLVPVPLGAWRWPDYPTRFYARDDVVAVVCPNRGPDSTDFVSVTIGARNAEALAFLEDLVDRSWEYYSPRDGAI